MNVSIPRWIVTRADGSKAFFYSGITVEKASRLYRMIFERDPVKIVPDKDLCRPVKEKTEERPRFRVLFDYET